MFCAGLSQRIAKCIFLSLLSFDLVLPATIETGFRSDEEEGYSGDENILRLDFFRFTTRKRYIWEDWTKPTREPRRQVDESIDPVFVWYFVIPFSVCVSLTIFVYLSVRYFCKNECCCDESDSDSSISSDRFTTVHRPPQRRANLSTQAHRPPAGRLGELDSNRGPGVTLSFINSTYSGSSQGGRGDHTDSRTSEQATMDLFGEHDRRLDSTVSSYSRAFPAGGGGGSDNSGPPVAEKPPDYSTVSLNDLVSPTRPAFPAVKTETPPPEYGKQNPFFK